MSQHQIDRTLMQMACAAECFTQRCYALQSLSMLLAPVGKLCNSNSSGHDLVLDPEPDWLSLIMARAGWLQSGPIS